MLFPYYNAHFFHSFFVFFFFNDTATTEIYTLSLHDALPISSRRSCFPSSPSKAARSGGGKRDRKSTRLNSSHVSISYAVFCLKKKKSQCHHSACGQGSASGECAASPRSHADNQRVASATFFFFNDTATTEIYTLSLHDALPISDEAHGTAVSMLVAEVEPIGGFV